MHKLIGIVVWPSGFFIAVIQGHTYILLQLCCSMQGLEHHTSKHGMHICWRRFFASTTGAGCHVGMASMVWCPYSC